ncbi:MAG: lysine--tRNA ligase [Planctomycetes bacterium]|nr:lysine--tRNA ligase [Planctomycetota bacterium]
MFDEYFEVRLEKANKLREAGVNPFALRFLHGTRIPVGDALANLKLADDGAPEQGQVFAICGRVERLNNMGKSMFLHVSDETGRVQIHVKKNVAGDDGWLVAENLDYGDIIGVVGEAFRTRTGEITLAVSKLQILTKALRPMPIVKKETLEDGTEVVHGAFKDTETRYRKRYLDLNVNKDSMERFRVRTRLISFIRRTLDEKGFFEVETPMMHSIPGGAKAKPFITKHNALDMNLYLRIAPELFLKRLIVGGFEKVYEINRNFRNEGISTRHNPEFTMMELYEAYSDFYKIADLTEEIVAGAAEFVLGTTTVQYGEWKLDFKRPLKRAKYTDLFREYVGISFDNEAAVIEKAKAHELYSPKLEYEVIANELFEEFVEPRLINPTFVTHYPTAISPLAKRCDDNPDFVERFELFAAGMELANAFSELNDPVDQRGRFTKQVQSKDEEAPTEVDEDYLEALEYGMPPAGGLGVGIDRLTMVLTGCTSIRDVVLFPLLKKVEGAPAGGETKEAKE